MDILNCGWDTARFLIFSDNVFAPFIYYTHLTPLLLSLAIGLFVYFKNPRGLLNQILLFITLSFAFWSFSDLVLWATEKPSYVMFFWSVTILLEPIMYAACVYFLYVFNEGKDISLNQKLQLVLPFVPTLIFLPTTLAIMGFDYSNCDREVVEGLLVFYGYLIEVFYVGWIIFAAVRKYLRTADKEFRRQIILCTAGILLFLLTLSLGNIIGSFSDNWSIGQYGLMGMPLFLACLGYLIVKYGVLNVRLFATQALTFALFAMFVSLLFIRTIPNVRLVTLLTLVPLTILSYFLVNSVRKDIQQQENIEKLVKARSEFLYVASHQLRTPVSLITGTLSLLKEGDLDKLSPEQKNQFIDGLFHKSQKLTNIVNDILQASEMDIVDFKLPPSMIKPVNLRAIVKEVCTNLKQKADERKLQLTCSGAESETPLMVSGNADYLEQVVSNLIDNAIKYTTAGQVKVDLRELGNKIIIQVSDTGIGIPVEDQAKMFEKFKRAKNASDSYTDGSGLGLFIVKKIVESHPGGRINFQSAGEGKGTTFTVELTKSK